VSVRAPFSIGEQESVRAACMGKGPGVVIIAGTGATVVAWDRRDHHIAVGGWGSPLGDEGGAYDTAMRAIRAAIYGEDGRGKPTSLGAAVREHFGISDLRRLPHIFYQERVPRHVVSRFCGRVFWAAQQGDAVARKVLADSGRELGLAARAAIGRLGLQRSRLDVVAAGGMTAAGRFVLAPLQREVARSAPRAQVRPANREPVVGCLLLALSRLGHPINEGLRRRVDASMAALGLIGWPGPGGQPLSH
jgi:N-acetylglucosamine kinase